MKILFRADASIQQGTGHLMRCLVLADELRERGHECLFLTQPFLPNILAQIENRRHKLVILEKNKMDPTNIFMNDDYLMWLGRTVVEDAMETLSVIKREQPSIIIADHYAINATWMNLISGSVTKTVIIDDLANRKHVCDVLIDQNFGRTAEHYQALVSPRTQILAGAEYIFIKNEFKKNRFTAQEARLNRVPRNLNICMGGIDKDNITYHVLEAVTKLDFYKIWNIDIVLSSAAPHLNMVRDYIKNQSRNVKLHLDVDNMASLFSRADLAIGAAGVTLWERCCMGLPSILLTIADNQIPAALAVRRADAGVYAADIREQQWTDKLSEQLSGLAQDFSVIHDMSRKSFDVCDGMGLDKVCNVIEHV